MMPNQAAARRTWTWPIVIAVGSLVGLVSALVGDGLYDALSWLLLAVPVAIAAVALTRRRTSRG
jgi:hypothetical protein